MSTPRCPRRLLTIGAAAGLVSCAALAAAQTPVTEVVRTESRAAAWDTVVYPLDWWVPYLGANMQVPGEPGTGEPPRVETSGGLNQAFAAGFRLERWRVSVQANALWAGLSGSAETPHAELNVDASYGQLLGGFEILRAIYIDGGVRRLALDMRATVFSSPEFTWKPEFWEPVAGVTLRPTLGRSTRLMIHADVGGLGDDNHRSVALKALIEWKPIAHFSLGGGWGVLYLRADGQVRTQPVHLQQTLNGPTLTLGIPF